MRIFWPPYVLGGMRKSRLPDDDNGDPSGHHSCHMSWVHWMTAAQPPQPQSSLIDEVLSSWASWREACEDVRSAYERWSTSGRPQRCLAFASYRAALEREELAAGIHSVLIERVRADGRGGA